MGPFLLYGEGERGGGGEKEDPSILEGRRILTRGAVRAALFFTFKKKKREKGKRPRRVLLELVGEENYLSKKKTERSTYRIAKKREQPRLFELVRKEKGARRRDRPTSFFLKRTASRMQKKRPTEKKETYAPGIIARKKKKGTGR